MGKDLLEKMNALLSHGWTKDNGKWVDPFTWKAHCFKEAYEIHLRYGKRHVNTK